MKAHYLEFSVPSPRRKSQFSTQLIARKIREESR